MSAPLSELVADALSKAGAFCGACGFEPGDRGCPDCERCWASYADALLPLFASARDDRDMEIVRWLGKKAREYEHQRNLPRYRCEEASDVLARMASKIVSGAVRPDGA